MWKPRVARLLAGVFTLSLVASMVAPATFSESDTGVLPREWQAQLLIEAFEAQQTAAQFPAVDAHTAQELATVELATASAVSPITAASQNAPLARQV